MPQSKTVNIKLFNEWLSEKCLPEDVAEKDGVYYLPIGVAEAKLDSMLNEFGISWHTRNYKSRHYITDTVHIVSASLELVLNGSGYFKVLVGTATFSATDYYPNTHLDPIAKSFCVVNSCHDLGFQFGRHLSQVNELSNKKDKSKRKEAVKMKPDKEIVKKYIDAVTNKKLNEAMQLEKIYDFSNIGK